MRVNNTVALALVNAVAAQVQREGDKPENWVSRRVIQQVENPKAGTHVVPSTKVVSSRGTFVKG